MSLNGALQIGRSAIVASQAAMQVAGNNMANAATPGFHRRTVHLAGARDEIIIAGPEFRNDRGEDSGFRGRKLRPVRWRKVTCGFECGNDFQRRSQFVRCRQSRFVGNGIPVARVRWRKRR